MENNFILSKKEYKFLDKLSSEALRSILRDDLCLNDDETDISLILQVMDILANRDGKAKPKDLPTILAEDD